MWRRPLNSTALATTTNKKLEKVSDRPSTQVEVQMINKCRIKIIQGELYNGRDPSWRGDQKNHKRNTVAIKNQICNQTCVKYIRTRLLGLCWWRFSLEKLIYLLVLDILYFRLTHFSPVFQPTLYKFIVLSFLGQSLFLSSWVTNLVLTIGAVCGKIGVTVSLMINNGRFKFKSGRIHRVSTSRSLPWTWAKERLGRECAYYLY